ncbi:MAG: ATP-dependent Clp protease ATP-binding subunit [Bryobacterales bacterium]|nr:ATP-dependent Clp protease ATP-binding subunit [Bryobacterales bacterium]
MLRVNKPLDPTLTGREAEHLEASLRRKVVGQDEAIAQIVNIYQTHQAGMSAPGRPIGNFLFLGPTGSGKTRLVEALAESLVGEARAVIKVDCAEFQHSHEIAKLIGSPPGYLGHRETHPLLSQEILNQYHTEKARISFVLFDEIEKASDALWNLLLGILDKATLTLGDNRRVDFSRAMIFLTSNLGAAEMGSILRPGLGFASPEAQQAQDSGALGAALPAKLARAGIEAARRKFTPEFINRLDKTVVFRPLGEAELRQILEIELKMVQQRVFDSASGTPFVFALTDDAKAHLLREGTDVKYGARHLKRAIERFLVHPLSNLIATGQVMAGDLVRVDSAQAGGQLSFHKEAEDMPAFAMAQLAGGAAAPSQPRAAGVAVELPRTGVRGTRRT